MARHAQITGQNQRRTNRLRPGFQDIVWKVENMGSAVQVLDLSKMGLKIRTDLPLERGDVLRITDEWVGELTARVVWKRLQAFGCEFDIALAPADVATLLDSSIRLCIETTPRPRRALA